MRRPVLPKPNQKGFTLIEVVLVVAVITILVGISLPSLLAYSRNAKEIERVHQEELANKAVKQYYAYTGAFPNLDSLEPDDGDKQLTDAQTVELKDDLFTVTSARLDITAYTYTYNERNGACSLQIK